LDRIRQSIESDDKHWRRVKEGLTKLLEGNFAVGVRAWQRLGDAIIALEAQERESDLYTTNRKHYGPLCTAIGLRLHEEEP
jgi:hypothetical protein